MEIIEFDKWKPSADDPRKLEYDGQRTAEDVFEQLKFRLDGQGYLPDEYFDLRSGWKDGREIPKDADLFCTVDYGESEGVYVDVYLKWFDEKQKKSITESFIVGKTLGESGSDLDRMFLTASAITKAVHGDLVGASFISLALPRAAGLAHSVAPPLPTKPKNGFAGPPSKPSEAGSMGRGGARECSVKCPAGRFARNGLCSDEGHRPVHLSDYDKAVLAIRDGEMSAFKELCPKVLQDQKNELLIETAGRPGDVGGRMMALVLSNPVHFSEKVYQTACQKAINIGDGDRARLLLTAADQYVENLSPSLHGEMAGYAYTDHCHIAREIVKHCNEEQIAAAPSYLLELFATGPDYEMLSTLVEKGISGGSSAARTLHMLTYEGRNSWIAEDLLEKRMWVDACDYGAFHTCVDNGAVDTAKLLLDGGMDFDQYRQRYPNCGSPDVIQALTEHWNKLQAQAQEAAEPEQAQAQEQLKEQETAGPEIGGMNLG